MHDRPGKSGSLTRAERVARDRYQNILLNVSRRTPSFRFVLNLSSLIGKYFFMAAL